MAKTGRCRLANPETRVRIPLGSPSESGCSSMDRAPLLGSGSCSLRAVQSPRPTLYAGESTSQVSQRPLTPPYVGSNPTSPTNSTSLVGVAQWKSGRFIPSASRRRNGCSTPPTDTISSLAWLSGRAPVSYSGDGCSIHPASPNRTKAGMTQSVAFRPSKPTVRVRVSLPAPFSWGCSSVGRALALRASRPRRNGCSTPTTSTNSLFVLSIAGTGPGGPTGFIPRRRARAPVVEFDSHSRVHLVHDEP